MGGLNWLQVAVISLFVIFIVRGYNRGFLRMAVSLTGLILVVYVATKLVPGTTEILINSDYVFNSVNGRINEVFHDINSKYNDSTKQEQDRAISEYDLPELVIADLIMNNTKEVYENMKVSIFEDYIAKSLTVFIIKCAVFVSLYAALALIMWVILQFTGIISRIPVIHGLNKYLGLASGGVLALLIVWIFFFILVMLLGNELADSLLADIHSDRFLSFLYNNDILFRIF